MRTRTSENRLHSVCSLSWKAFEMVAIGDSKDERMPLTALVPELPGQPLEIFDDVSAIHIALVDRDGVSRLGGVWDNAGVYLLLDPIASGGTWGVYVGKAAAGLKSRVRHHISGKDSWNRAVLVRRDTTHGFNSAHVGWLEGHLHQLLTASALARPSNKVAPSDESLAAHEQHALMACATGVIRTLRLLGFEPAAESELDGSATGNHGKRQMSTTTLPDLMTAGRVKVGEELVSLNSLWPASAKVAPDGQVIFDGTTFTSLSSAASAAKKGGAANGWEFWGVRRDSGLVPLAVFRSEFDRKKTLP